MSPSTSYRIVVSIGTSKKWKGYEHSVKFIPDRRYATTIYGDNTDSFLDLCPFIESHYAKYLEWYNDYIVTGKLK